jgi:hypothetical protein
MDWMTMDGMTAELYEAFRARGATVEQIAHAVAAVRGDHTIQRETLYTTARQVRGEAAVTRQRAQTLRWWAQLVCEYGQWCKTTGATPRTKGLPYA